jgi:chemotaxis methyl-accepting protein methylase
MKYEVAIKALDKDLSYIVKAENVLEAEEKALKELSKDIPKDYFTAGQYHIKHIENIVCDKEFDKQGKITAKFNDIK